MIKYGKMKDIEKLEKSNTTKQGLIAALVAYLCYGLLPIYIKMIDSIPSIEILAHRIIWSVPFGMSVGFGKKLLCALDGCDCHESTKISFSNPLGSNLR